MTHRTLSSSFNFLFVYKFLLLFFSDTSAETLPNNPLLSSLHYLQSLFFVCIFFFFFCCHGDSHRLTYDHDDEVQHLLNQGVLLDEVLWSRDRDRPGRHRTKLWGNPEPEQSGPTLLASLNLFLMSAELKIWNSSKRLRTIIRKWFGSIMDAPACIRADSCQWNQQNRQNRQVDIPGAWWCPCRTSPFGTWRCGSNRSERRKQTSSVRRPRPPPAWFTHLVDQREAVPPPHPSMHLGTEHQAA